MACVFKSEKPIIFIEINAPIITLNKSPIAMAAEIFLRFRLLFLIKRKFWKFTN